jgi:hypothetical protein
MDISEFLARINQNTNLSQIFVDQSERRVLWDLEAILEKQLLIPLMSNYPEIVKKARDAVRDQE